jgi:hypothetical protein
VRRATIVTLRSMIVLLLCAAVADLKIPGRSRDRVRLHLVDRSGSITKVEGPRESLKVEDADDIIAHDRETKASDDTVTWASFGRDIAFESKRVDASATDLSGALTAALGRNPTEIVLYTDGRADPGSALFLCRQRGVPVFVVPLGPTSVRDVRIVRIEAPPDAAPAAPVPVAVVVESTYDVRARVVVGSDTRDADLAANVPSRLSFILPSPGRFSVDLDVKDACAENNHAAVLVLERGEQRKLLAISSSFPRLPDFETTVSTSLPKLLDFDSVLLDNVALPLSDQQSLAAWVRAGGGLVLLGGPNSYAMGDWKGTPLEELSPLKAKPDLKVAAVFGIDASGSMSEEFESVVQVLLDARGDFDADDDLVAMTFGDDAKVMDFGSLRKVRPSGGTSIVKGIEAGRLHLESRPAGRKMLILMTDGETKETPEEIKAAVGRLKEIGLVVITTRQDVPGATNVHISDWNGLRNKLREVTFGIQDLFKDKPGSIEIRSHPVTAGVTPLPLAWINRTTAKPDAQVLATVGRAPSQDPVLALGRAGEGRVAAFAASYDPGLARLFRQAIEHVAGDADKGLQLSIDPPFVRARGSFKETRFETTMTKVEMKQVASDAWEGRLPDGLSGTVMVRKGRARAAATIPCPPEYEKLGVDRAALERIAKESGGRVLGSPSELAALPRRESPAPRSGRTLFLIAALALVFAEMGVSTFWKV